MTPVAGESHNTLRGPLSLADLDTTGGDEPRIKDVRLGECLGMAQPLNIRQVIEKNRAELEGFGSIHAARELITGGKGARRNVTIYWLTEPQALLICMFSRTPTAAQVRRELVLVFMEYRRQASRSVTPLAVDGAGTPLSLTEQEIMVALAFRRQVQAAVAARRFELGATASIAVTQILTGTLTYDINSRRFTHCDAAAEA